MGQHTIESVANELHKAITEETDKKLETQIGLQAICILGNYQTHEQKMVLIAQQLCDLNYPATLIKKIPDGVLPDFEKEKKIIEKASCIVLIDTDKGGAVGESTFMIENGSLLEKAVLLVPNTVNEDTFFCTKKHYVYYSRKVRYQEDHLVETAVKAAKQLSHNLALKVLRENKL
jgi:hypothetical protein